MIDRKYIVPVLFVMAIFLTSCLQEDNMAFSNKNTIGEIEVTRPGEGANSKFSGIKTKLSNDTIYLQIPYFYPENSDSEVDLSNLILRLPVSVGAKVIPTLGVTMDLRKPLPFSVIAQDGTKKEYVLVASKVGNLEVLKAEIQFLNSDLTWSTKEAEIKNDTVIFLVNTEISDVSKAKLVLEINKHSEASIKNGSEIDLQKNIPLLITGVDKSKKTYTIETRMPKILPYGIGEKRLLWRKNYSELSNFPTDARSVIVSGNYLILVDGSKTGAPYLLYDRFTGNYVKNLPNPPAPGIRTMTMANDSAGHFIVTSWSGSAGNYKVYLYKNVEDTPQLLIDWKVDDGIGIGRRLNIYGDLTKDAEIIATGGGGSHHFRRWVIRNGNLENNNPEKVTYESTTQFWDGTEVQPVGVSTSTKKSNYFISLFGIDGATEGTRGIQWADGASNTLLTQFNAYPSLNGVAQISLEYIRFNNANYLANIKFSNYSWQNLYENVDASLCLFDVTKKSYYNLTPSDALFSKFLVFTSNLTLSVNPNNNPRDGRGNADICYCLSEDGNSLYIYTVLTDGGVMAYQFTKYSS